MPEDSLGLQFGLQFTTVQRRPRRIDHRHWSRLNRSERPRSELLMRLGFTPVPLRALTPTERSR